jgi:hypothetical protein
MSSPFNGQTGQDGSSWGVRAQQYAADGVRVGPEFGVNTYTLEGQGPPYTAMDADGDFVVAWESQEQDGSGLGVYAQRFSSAPTAAEPGATAGLSIVLTPNPVGARGVAVRLSLFETGPARVSVVDALGREVAVPLDGVRAAGAHEVPLDTSRLPAGVYVVRVVAGGAVTGTRLVVAR